MSYIGEAKTKLEAAWSTRMNGRTGMAKIFTVNRGDLDQEGDDEPDAWKITFIDDGNVARHETFIDCAFGRFGGILDEQDDEILESCPDRETVRKLMEYIESEA